MKPWARPWLPAVAMSGLLVTFPTQLARAQESIRLPPITVLPEITVTAPPRGAGAGSGQPGGGAGDRSGEGKPFETLNRQLRRKVEEVNPVINAPPLDARSPDTKIGVINIPGVQQQYGRNFGQSAFPYRPPAPVYGSPLGRR